MPFGVVDGRLFEDWTCAGDSRHRHVKGDVTALATGLAQQLKSARWAAVLPSIIDAAEREPELAQLLAQLHAGQMVPYFAVAERAKKRGELAPGTTCLSL